MFTNIFLERDKKVSSIIKLGTSLGRSLRENVELLSIEGDSIIYLTESERVIRGNYNYDNGPGLTNIQLETSEVFTDKKKFNKFINARASRWLDGVFQNNLSEATHGWDNLLRSWEYKLKFNHYREKLQEKAEKIFRTSGMVGTPEFQKVLELTPNLVKFLAENKKDIQDIEELRNAIKLSYAVSKAFDFPRLTTEELKENESYKLKDSVSSSMFDMLCRREMLATELLETKEQFDTLWATHDGVIELAGYALSEDTDAIHTKLAECIKDVPYLALATKKQLTNLFKNSLSIDEASLTQNELQKFVSFIFEAKKPVRKALLEILNEKYGLNIQGLKDPVSFRTLADTQVVIFETLAKISPKKSALKETLSDFTEVLKLKSGVESLDVMDYLAEVFAEAEYTELLTENQLFKYLDFASVANDLDSISQVLKLIKQSVGGGGMEAGMAPEQPGMGAEQPGMQTGEEQYPSDETLPLDGETEEEEGGTPAMSPEDAAMAAKGEMAAGPEGEAGIPVDPEEEGEEEMPPEDISADDLNSQLSRLDQLISDLAGEIEGAADMAGGEEEEGFPGEEEEEGFPGEEGEEELDPDQEEEVGIAVDGEAVDGEEADQDGDGDVDGADIKSLKKKKKKFGRP